MLPLLTQNLRYGLTIQFFIYKCQSYVVLVAICVVFCQVITIHQAVHSGGKDRQTWMTTHQTERDMLVCIHQQPCLVYSTFSYLRTHHFNSTTLVQLLTHSDDCNQPPPTPLPFCRLIFPPSVIGLSLLPQLQCGTACQSRLHQQQPSTRLSSG